MPETPEQMFETPHQAPQPSLWAWYDDEWLPELRQPLLCALDEIGI